MPAAATSMKNTIYEIIKIYTRIDDLASIKDLAPIATCSFLVIYCTLLIIDGYYFLVFLFLGFAGGALYFNGQNNDGNLKIEQYERNLSYTEQTLEEVSVLRHTFFMHESDILK